MEDHRRTQEVLGQYAGKAMEAATIWADANQRVLRELVEIGAATATEGVRLYAELQQGALAMLRDGQAAAVRWQAGWQEAPKDPLAWCEKTVGDSVEGAHKALRILEGNTQAMARSAERLQAAAAQAGKGLQETFTSGVSKLKDVYPETVGYFG